MTHANSTEHNFLNSGSLIYDFFNISSEHYNYSYSAVHTTFKSQLSPSQHSPTTPPITCLVTRTGSAFPNLKRKERGNALFCRTLEAALQMHMVLLVRKENASWRKCSSAMPVSMVERTRSSTQHMLPSARHTELWLTGTCHKNVLL